MLAKFVKKTRGDFIINSREVLHSDLLFYFSWIGEDLAIDTALLKDHLIGGQSTCFITKQELNLTQFLN